VIDKMDPGLSCVEIGDRSWLDYRQLNDTESIVVSGPEMLTQSVRL